MGLLELRHRVSWSEILIEIEMRGGGETETETERKEAGGGGWGEEADGGKGEKGGGKRREEREEWEEGRCRESDREEMAMRHERKMDLEGGGRCR